MQRSALKDCIMDVENFQAFVDALPYPAFFVSDNFTIQYTNSSAIDLLGYGLEGNVFARALRHPEAVSCLKAALETNEIQSCDLELSVSTSRSFQGSAAPVGPYILFTLLDISAELDAEKARSTFVANVSHELRSPLTALIGVVETLKGPARNDDKARDRFLDLMQGEAERMSRLVGDLLSLSKLEAKEHLRPVDSVDLVMTIERVVAVLMESTPDYKGRVTYRAPDESVIVIGDRDEITEVFQNLIENALKYSPSDTDVTVSVSIDERQHNVTVKINDLGEGIDKKHLPRLTERFYRVDKGRSREMGGTGLGLAIVKHILNRHRADLKIYSKLGVGTVAEVVFDQKP